MSTDKVTVPSLAPISSPVSSFPLSPSPSSFPSIPSPKISAIPKPATKPLPKTINTISTITPTITVKPVIDIIEEMQDKDLSEITNSNIENELAKLGYLVINKIVVLSENGNKKLQYIKAINKKGQKVYILIDIISYMSVHPKDLMIRENSDSNCIPFSLKNGAYNSAVKDVSGVAFEYGSNSICTLIMDPGDLSIKEKNYTFNEQKFCRERHEYIMIYPIIRLSEIKVNPKIILDNTHIVINRLRNAEELYERNELTAQRESITKLDNAFADFATLCDDVADKLYSDLNQLEDWNEVYINDPPYEDEYKERFIKLQVNLIKRNDDATNLIKIMKKVADERKKIDAITTNINEIINYCQKEFSDLI